MVPLEVEQWLSSIKANRSEVFKRAEAAVRHYCNQKNYAYLGRQKSDESVAEKLETGRVRALLEIDDLFACSVIIPSLSHEPAIIADLEAMFSLETLKRREATFKNPDVFRFEATRCICRLRTTEIDPQLAQILFEVQIRTAFEHAWSVATHSEAYKGDNVDWKLERLAAQMKALVEQLDMLAVAYQESADSIVQHPCDKTDCEAYVLEKFQELCSELPVPEECRPVQWGMFARNLVGFAEAVDWGARLALKVRVERMVLAATDEANLLGKSKYPLSLTLFQFAIGAAIQRGIVRAAFRRDNYFPPISAALELIFPKTKAIVSRCNLAVEAQSTVEAAVGGEISNT